MSSAAVDPWDHTEWRTLARASPRATSSSGSGAHGAASAASYHVAHAQSHAHCDAGTKTQRAQANKGYYPFPAKAFRAAGGGGGSGSGAFPAAPPPRARLSDPMLPAEGSRAQQRRRALAKQKPPQRSPEWQQLEAETEAYFSHLQPQRPPLWEPKHAPPPRPQPVEPAPQLMRQQRPQSAKPRPQQQPQLMHSQSTQQQRWQPQQQPSWPPSDDVSYSAVSGFLRPQHPAAFPPQHSAYNVQGQFHPTPPMQPSQPPQPHPLATSYSSIAFPSPPSEPAREQHQAPYPPQVAAPPPPPSAQAHTGNVRTLRPASAPPARLQRPPFESPPSLQMPQGYDHAAAVPASAAHAPYPSHSRPSAAELLHSAARSSVAPAGAAALSASSSQATTGHFGSSGFGFGFDGGEEAWQRQSLPVSNGYDSYPQEEEKEQFQPFTMQSPLPPLSAHEQQYNAQLYARRPRPSQAASTASSSALGARTGTGGGARAGPSARSRRGGHRGTADAPSSSSAAATDEDAWSSLYLSRLLSKASSGQAEASFFAKSSAVLRRQACPASRQALYCAASRSGRRTGWWQPPPNSELLSSEPSAEAARAPTAWLQPTPLPHDMRRQDQAQRRSDSALQGQVFEPTESHKVWEEIQQWRAQQQQQQQHQQQPLLPSAPPAQSPSAPIYSPLQLSDEAAFAMFARGSSGSSADERDGGDDSESGSASHSTAESSPSSASTPRAAPPASVPPLHMDHILSPQR